MAVWPSFAALAVLAFIGPVMAQNSPAVMMPGVNSRSSSSDMATRRRRPVRNRITPSPDAQLPPNAESANLRLPIYFPPNLQGMYDQPAIVPLPAENRPVEGRETPSIVMTDDMDFDKMEIGNLRMLNSISTMEEFAAMFGFEMPVAANDSGSGIAPRFGGNGGTEVDLPQATCRPENKTVVLDIPPELNVAYIPSCVRLQRCGGCCIGSMFKCRPSKTEAVSIKVLRLTSSPPPRTRASRPETDRQRPGSSGRDASTRRRRQNVAQIIIVPEEQHIECDCQCRVQEQDCNPALQEYMPDNCRCQCLNSDEEEKCAAQPMTHYWDDDQCTCFCIKTVNCSVTLRFDHTTCSCVQIPHNLLPDEGSAVNPRAGFVGENALDEESERFRRDHIPVTFGALGRRAGSAAGAGEQPPHA